MRAILYDPSAPHGLRLDEAPDPKPGEHEALLGAGMTLGARYLHDACRFAIASFDYWVPLLTRKGVMR